MHDESILEIIAKSISFYKSMPIVTLQLIPAGQTFDAPGHVLFYHLVRRARVQSEYPSVGVLRW